MAANDTFSVTPGTARSSVADGAAAEVAGLPERLWSLPETARFLGLPIGTLYQLNYKGTGPRSYKIGRYRRYDPRDVIAWLADRCSDRDARPAL
jgi:predicted DNA-binding transcriptional regulator AlpA